MQQVADAAGVHRTTVSLALRHHPGIPQATRERVCAVAEQMGYSPNPLVSALMSQLRSQRQSRGDAQGVIALISSHPAENPLQSHSSLSEMIRGAKMRARSLGFVLETFYLREPNMTSQRLRKILRARGVRALIIAPLPNDETTFEMDLDGFAAVALGISLRYPALERIASDHYHCMQLAFANCLRLGYSRIGLCIDKVFSSRLEDRWLAGFLSSQMQVPAACRIPPLLDMCLIPSWLCRERPDVLIVPMTSQWQELQLANNNIPVVNLTRVPGDTACAGIDQDMFKVGSISVERVIARLNQNDFGALDKTQNTLLHGTWKDGASLPPKLPEAEAKAQASRGRLRGIGKKKTV